MVAMLHEPCPHRCEFPDEDTLPHMVQAEKGRIPPLVADENQTVTHYHWATSRDYGLDSKELDEELDEETFAVASTGGGGTLEEVVSIQAPLVTEMNCGG